MIAPSMTASAEAAPTEAPASAVTSGEDVPAVAAARQVLAQQIRTVPEAIRVISLEAVDWPDGCLGVYAPGVSCIQVIVPGYRIVLEAEGRRYTYHTDREGRWVVRADPRP